MASNTEFDLESYVDENADENVDTSQQEETEEENPKIQSEENGELQVEDSVELRSNRNDEEIDSQVSLIDAQVNAQIEQTDAQVGTNVDKEEKQTETRKNGEGTDEEGELEMSLINYNKDEAETATDHQPLERSLRDTASPLLVLLDPSPSSLPDSNVDSPAPPSISLPSTPDIKYSNEVFAKIADNSHVRKVSSAEKKDELMIKLDNESKKEALFQQRCFIVASNYEEMIKMKDEYKAENEKLRMDNLQMKLENTRIFTEKLESKERDNLKLQQTIDYLKRQLVDTECKLKSANDDYRTLCRSYEERIRRLVDNLSVAEETLADTVYKLRQQEIVRSRQDQESRRQCERLQKEKDDLMQLALSGGKRIYLS